MDTVLLDEKLKKYFGQQLIVFGGSQINGQTKKHSDVDVYIIFKSIFDFYATTRHKASLLKIKKNLGENINLHLLPLFILRAGFYGINGFYYKKGQPQKFVKKGDNDIIFLNSFKLCLKHLILYKLEFDDEVKSEIHFKNLQKNYAFLTGIDFQNIEDDLDEIENNLENKLNKAQKFLIKDWLFYCLRFRRPMPFDFEKHIIACLFALKRYINTDSLDYVQEFFAHFKHLQKDFSLSQDSRQMFELINRYIFLIYII